MNLCTDVGFRQALVFLALLGIFRGETAFAQATALPPMATMAVSVSPAVTFDQLAAQLELLPPGHFDAHLASSPIAARLSYSEQTVLLRRHEHPSWKRGAAFALNAILFPGVGSFLQADYLAGGIMAGVVLAGVGLLLVRSLGGIDCAAHLATHPGDGCNAGVRGNTPLLIVGGLLIFGGWAAGVIRPWLVEGRRHRSLRRFFSKRILFGRAEVEVTPRLEIGPRVGALPPSYGLGLEASF